MCAGPDAKAADNVRSPGSICWVSSHEYCETFRCLQLAESNLPHEGMKLVPFDVRKPITLGILTEMVACSGDSGPRISRSRTQ